MKFRRSLKTLVELPTDGVKHRKLKGEDKMELDCGARNYRI